MNVSHYEKSDNAIERAMFFLVDRSWSSGGDNFQVLQNLSLELEQYKNDREILMALLYNLTYSDNVADTVSMTLQLLGIEIEWDDLDHLFKIWANQGTKSLWAIELE